MCLIEFSGTWPNPFLQTKGAMLMRCQNADALEALKTLGRKFKAQEGARLVELLKTHIGTAVILVLLSYWYCCHIGTAAILVLLSYCYCCHIGITVILVFLLYWCYFILPSSNQRVSMLR